MIKLKLSFRLLLEERVQKEIFREENQRQFLRTHGILDIPFLIESWTIRQNTGTYFK